MVPSQLYKKLDQVDLNKPIQEENDTFDAVNKRELELGAATMTSLVYLYDKYGLVKQIPSTLKK